MEQLQAQRQPTVPSASCACANWTRAASWKGGLSLAPSTCASSSSGLGIELPAMNDAGALEQLRLRRPSRQQPGLPEPAGSQATPRRQPLHRPDRRQRLAAPTCACNCRVIASTSTATCRQKPLNNPASARAKSTRSGAGPRRQQRHQRTAWRARQQAWSQSEMLPWPPAPARPAGQPEPWPAKLRRPAATQPAITAARQTGASDH